MKVSSSSKVWGQIIKILSMYLTSQRDTQAPMKEAMKHEEDGGNTGGVKIKMLNKNPTKKLDLGSKYCVTLTIIHTFT